MHTICNTCTLSKSNMQKYVIIYMKYASKESEPEQPSSWRQLENLTTQTVTEAAGAAGSRPSAGARLQAD
jgi:hypothetical protein